MARPASVGHGRAGSPDGTQTAAANVEKRYSASITS
jgi:hypothetical protein